MTKWLVQKPTNRTTQKHVQQPDATDIQNKQKHILVNHRTKGLYAPFSLIPLFHNYVY